MERPTENHGGAMHREVVLSRPVRAHGAEIHRLINACKPLDLNSTYAYLLLCEHFAETCVRAERDGRTVGFVSAYRPPLRRDVLFVWQVAVAAHMRGRGLARSMLHELLRRDARGGWRYLETTVTPSNEPSRRLFHALAADLEAPVAESVLFAGHDFDGEPHESEILIRIGPVNGRQPKGELIDEPEYL